jgi:hypothetical protein
MIRPRLQSTRAHCPRNALLFALGALACACTRGEPPTLTSAASASVAPMPPAPPRIASAAPSTSATVAVDPGTLPQTRTRPEDDTAELSARAQALWDGIQSDDPERAMAFFFPRSAYEQVKALADPARDWRYRLVAHYKRDIHLAHEKLGREATAARFAGLEVGAHARWVEPGEEGNKLGYYRVYGSRLRFTVEGRERSIPISSLISWRGEWYVVHLSGFS